MPRPRKYHTEEARREAIRQASRKYYNTHREAINARRGERRKRSAKPSRWGRRRPGRERKEAPRHFLRGEGWRGG